MISYLQYDITFANLKTLSQELNFEAGSTLITGKNGKGKSMTFEMIAYALFGASALRGVATDYKSIELELVVAIKDKIYNIKRTKTKAAVFLNDEQIVSGAKPVNTWVIRTLGYNFDVFKIAHWCAQGDIQALANMRPTERKAMIDSVAGLTQMDSLMDSLKITLREQKAAIEQQESLIQAPKEPLKPELASESKITLALKGLDVEAEKLAKATAIRLPVEPVAPIKPTEILLPEKPEKAELVQEAPKPPAIPDWVEGDFETFFKTLALNLQQNAPLFNNWVNAQNKYQPEVKLPNDYKTQEAIVAAWDNYALRQKLDRLESGELINCPHCKKGFHLEHDEIDTLRAMKLPKKAPKLTVQEWLAIEKQLNLNAEYLTLDEQIRELNLVENKRRFNELSDLRVKLQQYKQDLARYTELVTKAENRYVAQVKAWEVNCATLDSQREQLMQQYHIATARYLDAKEHYMEDLTTYNEAQETLKRLIEDYGADIQTALNNRRSELNQQLSQWRVYDRELDIYTQQVKSFAEHQRVIDKQKAFYDEHLKARAAVKEVKDKVQNFLIPSLNKVASYLMYEMTGGLNQRVEIQPDFEVTVDSQPLRTLNGSSKDIANLALRIGLGRILTHKVLPVMMLDEIDSAMDEERANYTWGCIQKITPQVGQVLQASHKELEAESRVEI
jgi:recombinational DNA repair ATPase RecF